MLCPTWASFACACSTAILNGVGSSLKSVSPRATRELSTTSTFRTWPATSGAMRTTNACTRALLVNGVVRSATT